MKNLTITQQALLAAAAEKMRELQMIFDAMLDPELQSIDVSAFGPLPGTHDEGRAR